MAFVLYTHWAINICTHAVRALSFPFVHYSMPGFDGRHEQQQMMSFLASSQALFNGELVSDEPPGSWQKHDCRWQGHSPQPQHFCSAFSHTVICEGKVCSRPGKHGICVYCAWITSSSEMPIAKHSCFLGRVGRTQRVTWLATGAHHHFFPSLAAFTWTPLGSELPAFVLSAHSKALSPPYIWHKNMHRVTMVR